MIGKLKGLVDSVGEDWVLIDVGGVGYEVSCSPRTLAALPGVGEPVALAIETYVREDQIRLFGFSSDEERAWFRLLQSVQGVGAKVALAILGTLPPNELASAVALQDKAQLTRAPGIGPKVAQRIVSELKDKGAVIAAIDPGIAVLADKIGTGRKSSAVTDAVSALTNLGYASSEASAAVAHAMKEAGEAAKAEELIRIGLKELGQ